MLRNEGLKMFWNKVSVSLLSRLAKWQYVSQIKIRYSLLGIRWLFLKICNHHYEENLCVVGFKKTNLFFPEYRIFIQFTYIQDQNVYVRTIYTEGLRENKEILKKNFIRI